MPSSRSPGAPPVVLTIAGSDSGGGAGIQADLKTFAAHGLFGTSAITALTAQNTRAVTAVHVAPPDMVAAQIDAVLDDFPVAAVKIGMLASPGIVRAVAERLTARQPPNVVLDPVMVAQSGDSLLEQEAVAALREELLPLADVLTPNLPEAAALTDLTMVEEKDRLEAARRLMAVGASAVLVKGGHGEGDLLVDLLLHGEGEVRRIEHRRIPTRALHGTGCTLSSAIACGLATGLSTEEAVERGVAYLRGALEESYTLGAGHGPVNHLHGISRAPKRSG